MIIYSFIICYVLILVGGIVCSLGIMNLGLGHKNTITNSLMAGIGGVLLVASVGFAMYTNQQNEKILLAEIATQLGADSSEFIIEDLSEEKLFGPSKNTNLRKVYYDNTTYLLELEGYSIKKMVKQTETQND